MNNITAITPTQLLLWILLTFLLAWMVTFAILALKHTPELEVEQKDITQTTHVTPRRTHTTPTALEATISTLTPNNALVQTEPLKEMVLEG